MCSEIPDKTPQHTRMQLSAALQQLQILQKPRAAAPREQRCGSAAAAPPIHTPHRWEVVAQRDGRLLGCWTSQWMKEASCFWLTQPNRFLQSPCSSVLGPSASSAVCDPRTSLHGSCGGVVSIFANAGLGEVTVETL